MRLIARFLIIWMLCLATGLPRALAQDAGPSLLGVASVAGSVSVPPAPTLGMTAEEAKGTDPGAWSYPQRSAVERFVRGFFRGLKTAIPNLIEAFRKDPVKALAVMGAMVALGFASPLAAAAVGHTLLAIAAYRTGWDADAMGQLAGETVFWMGAGYAGARAWKSLTTPPMHVRKLKDGRFIGLDDTKTYRPIRRGQRFDTVHGMPVRPGQHFNGQLYNAFGEPLLPWYSHNIAVERVGQAGLLYRVPRSGTAAALTTLGEHNPVEIVEKLGTAEELESLRTRRDERER